MISKSSARWAHNHWDRRFTLDNYIDSFESVFRELTVALFLLQSPADLFLWKPQSGDLLFLFFGSTKNRVQLFRGSREYDFRFRPWLRKGCLMFSFVFSFGLVPAPSPIP